MPKSLYIIYCQRAFHKSKDPAVKFMAVPRGVFAKSKKQARLKCARFFDIHPVFTHCMYQLGGIPKAKQSDNFGLRAAVASLHWFKDGKLIPNADTARLNEYIQGMRI